MTLLVRRWIRRNSPSESAFSVWDLKGETRDFRAASKSKGWAPEARACIHVDRGFSGVIESFCVLVKESDEETPREKLPGMSMSHQDEVHAFVNRRLHMLGLVGQENRRKVCVSRGECFRKLRIRVGDPVQVKSTIGIAEHDPLIF